MLGQQIGDERGKVTARRVLPSDGQGPKMEVTFEAKGHFVGIEAVDVGTYWTVVQANGLLYGEGEGFITTQQGDIVQWTGSGRGRLTPQGGASFRGAIYYRAPAAKFAHVNEVAGVYEHEVDHQGNVTTKVWEWK
jgi:hypothetical protein